MIQAWMLWLSLTVGWQKRHDEYHCGLLSPERNKVRADAHIWIWKWEQWFQHCASFSHISNTWAESGITATLAFVNLGPASLYSRVPMKHTFIIGCLSLPLHGTSCVEWGDPWAGDTQEPTSNDLIFIIYKFCTTAAACRCYQCQQATEDKKIFQLHGSKSGEFILQCAD